MKIGTAEVKISKASTDTGLCDLPEDMYWEINQNSVFGNHYWNRGVPRDFLALRLMKIETSMVTKQPNNFWEVLTGRHNRIITNEVAVLRKGLWDTRNGSTASYSAFRKDGWVETSNGFVRQWTLTPELLASTSVTMWKDYLNSQHHDALLINKKMALEAEANKWVGKYPPKSVKGIH